MIFPRFSSKMNVPKFCSNGGAANIGVKFKKILLRRKTNQSRPRRESWPLQATYDRRGLPIYEMQCFSSNNDSTTTTSTKQNFWLVRDRVLKLHLVRTGIKSTSLLSSQIIKFLWQWGLIIDFLNFFGQNEINTYSGQIKGADSENDTPNAWKSTVDAKLSIFWIFLVKMRWTHIPVKSRVLMPKKTLPRLVSQLLAWNNRFLPKNCPKTGIQELGKWTQRVQIRETSSTVQK